MESRNAPLFLANRPPRRSVGAGFDCDSRLRLAFGERARMCSGGCNDGCCRGHNHTVAFSFSRRGLIARHRRPDRRSARGLSQSRKPPSVHSYALCRAAIRWVGSARFVLFLSAMSSTKKGGPSPTKIRDEPLKPLKSHQNPGRGHCISDFPENSDFNLLSQTLSTSTRNGCSSIFANNRTSHCVCSATLKV